MKFLRKVSFSLLCKPFIYAILAFFLTNCASVVPPTGGETDIIAPRLLNTNPKNESTNFQGKTIELVFDEWITTESFTTELVVTPAFKDYDYKTQKNKLIITLKEPLQENTTYNFNFRKSIVDITEGNANKNLRLAFSTGDILDSLSIKGNIKNFLDNTPQEDVVITLYPVDDTLGVEKDPPFYFAYTDEEGNYSLENIKAGEYKVYAFADENNNLTYEEPEAIAFLKEAVNLSDSSLNNVELNIARENNSIPEILSSRAKGVYFDISFSEGLTKVEVEGDTKYNLIGKNDVLRFYNINQVFDSIPLRIVAEDSAGNILEEELNIAFNEKTKEKATPLQMSVELEGRGSWENRVTFEIRFNKPIQEADLSKIKYRKDWKKAYSKQSWSEQFYYLAQGEEVETQSLLTGNNDFEWNDTKTVLKIDTVFEFKENFEILIEELAFLSVEQDTSTFFNQSYVKKDPKNFGTIAGSVNTDKNNYTLQLLNDKQEVIKELKNPKKFYFQFLPAGFYLIRVLIDENENGRWDGSNVLENIETEPIFFYKSPIKLRENWDIEDVLLEF